MTRIPKLMLLGTLALSQACAGENPSAPPLVSARSASSANQQVTRPAGGSCTYSIHSVVFQPTVLLLDMTALCNLQHLGRATAVVHQECYNNGSCANWVTYTAANGDLLHSTWYSAPGQGSTVGLHTVFSGTETFVGGTGRFAGASGSTSGSGTADYDPGMGSGTGQGSSYGTITF